MIDWNSVVQKSIKITYAGFDMWKSNEDKSTETVKHLKQHDGANV